MTQCLISVIMPVLNGEDYLAEAIESVLNQTYKDLELIIIDDGSSDKTPDIIASYKDPRVRVIKHHKNKGVSTSRNEAIKAARGKYLGMHDADDISLPERFEKQVGYLEKHQDIDLLGSNLQIIDKEDNYISVISLLTSPDDLKLAEIFSNQFGQGSVMIRKAILDEVGLYDPSLTHAEDTDLWRRVCRIGKAANLKEPLYLYRVHEAGASTNLQKIRDSALKTTSREFDYYLKNKGQYTFFAFHPFSMYGGLLVYLKRKGAMYGLMALMYCRMGRRRKAVPILLLAILHSPWSKKLYSQLMVTIKSRELAAGYPYEFF